MLQKEQSKAKSNQVEKLSSWSMGLSLLCAIHCMATPIFVAGVSLMGVSFLADPFWEMLILGMSAIIALVALTTSYVSHKNSLPFLIFGFGFLFILPGLIWHIHWIISIGSLVSACALLVNWRIKKQHVACC